MLDLTLQKILEDFSLLDLDRLSFCTEVNTFVLVDWEQFSEEDQVYA